MLKRQPWLAILISVVISLLIMGGLAAGVYFAVPGEEPVARGYTTACYREQGGDKWVCGSGGEMEFQSGAVLELQSGATVTMTTYTINGDGTFTGTVQGEHLYSTDDAEISDALTANSASITESITAADFTASGTITTAAFTLGGTSITATGSEINTIAGIATSAVFTIGSELTDTITVNVQLIDANGDDEVLVTALWGYLSGDSGGTGIIGTAPTGGIAAGTDGTIVAEPVDNKLFLAESEADGDLDFTLEEAGNNSFYLVLITPSGRMVVSDEINFD
jgi:hypothetical protein